MLATPTSKPTPVVGPTAREWTVTRVSIDPPFASACGITGTEVFFEYDSAALQVPEGSALDLIGDCLAAGAMKDRRVQLIGYTDPNGSDAYNDELGKSRAESVRDYFVGRGLASDRIDVVSMGEYGRDASAVDWPYDRRVEVRLAKER
jgi:outer membrane protein OmpA-like peptidoglycan-associated protein